MEAERDRELAAIGLTAEMLARHGTLKVYADGDRYYASFDDDGPIIRSYSAPSLHDAMLALAQEAGGAGLGAMSTHDGWPALLARLAAEAGTQERQ